MRPVVLCQCVFPVGDEEEKEALLEEGALLNLVMPKAMMGSKKTTGDMMKKGKTTTLASPGSVVPLKSGELMRTCNRALDMFKGVLVIFMTYAHVDLTLMNPALQVYAPMPHFIGNAASGLCFLGFMLAYGFSCDNAYISDWKPRTLAQRLERVFRSAMLPVMGAWACAFGWGYMCWKLPLTLDGVLQILDFRLTLGNGPDFLLCFTFSLLTMFTIRHWVNAGLEAEQRWKRALTVGLMLVLPLMLTQVWIPDCTGMKKYMGYLFECTLREPYAPVLPALPHLFYFNLGVLLSRHLKSVEGEIAKGGELDVRRLGAAGIFIAGMLAILAYPVVSVWGLNYGNLMASTRWGPVTRGFMDGPSPLWLLGNLFPVYVAFALTLAVHVYAEKRPWLMWLPRVILSELEHLGGNVLLYLVVGDICLAGLWRGMMNQYPLDTAGCGFATLMICMVTRFIHYLGASSRPAPSSKSGKAPKAGGDDDPEPSAG